MAPAGAHSAHDASGDSAWAIMTDWTKPRRSSDVRPRGFSVAVARCSMRPCCCWLYRLEKEGELERAKIYRKHVLPNDKPLHARASDAVSCIQCGNMDGSEFPDWDCVLRRCLCCPEYLIPKEERGTDGDAPLISFHVYEIKTSCSKHGLLIKGAKTCPHCVNEPTPPPPPKGKPPPKKPKISDRKHLSRLTRPIGDFHRNFYLPALEKLAYHVPYIRILSNAYCGALRDHAFQQSPGSAKTKRDYAERLLAAFNLEIQAEHFGNGRSLSMEGSSVEIFARAAVIASLAGDYTVADALPHLRMDFHSHFSDASRQDAATTHAHMWVLLDLLMRGTKELIAGAVLYDDTDGCGKQYRCAKALYLLSLLSSVFGVAIDRIVEWTSDPYTLQADVELTEYKPAMKLKAGELVCDAIYREKAPGAKLWFTRTIGEQVKTKVRMGQVLAPDLRSFEPISTSNPVPSRLSKKQKKEFNDYKAERLGVDEHEAILDEICRRDILEYDEEDDSEVESDDSSAEESSGDDEEGE